MEFQNHLICVNIWILNSTELKLFYSCTTFPQHFAICDIVVTYSISVDQEVGIKLYIMYKHYTNWRSVNRFYCLVVLGQCRSVVPHKNVKLYPEKQILLFLNLYCIKKYLPHNRLPISPTIYHNYLCKRNWSRTVYF